MKKIDQLVFPKNLAQILETDGIWSDDTFDPITVTVVEAEYNGDEITSYQLEITAGGDFEAIEAVMEANGMESSGLDWEDLIREYIHRIDSVLENKIMGDSEGATCVLWVRDESSFRKILGHVLDMTGDIVAVKRLF